MSLDKEEVQYGTVWRKWLSYIKNDDSFFNDDEFAVVMCVREISGYAVWYRRNIQKMMCEEAISTKDGDYLLKFFSPAAKYEAIEFAVKIAGANEESAVAISRLDEIARSALVVEKQTGLCRPFEKIN